MGAKNGQEIVALFLVREWRLTTWQAATICGSEGEEEESVSLLTNKY